MWVRIMRICNPIASTLNWVFRTTVPFYRAMFRYRRYTRLRTWL